MHSPWILKDTPCFCAKGSGGVYWTGPTYFLIQMATCIYPQYICLKYLDCLSLGALIYSFFNWTNKRIADVIQARQDGGLFCRPSIGTKILTPKVYKIYHLHCFLFFIFWKIWIDIVLLEGCVYFLKVYSFNGIHFERCIFRTRKFSHHLLKPNNHNAVVRPSAPGKLPRFWNFHLHILIPIS